MHTNTAYVYSHTCACIKIYVCIHVYAHKYIYVNAHIQNTHVYHTNFKYINIFDAMHYNVVNTWGFFAYYLIQKCYSPLIFFLEM